MVLISLSQKFKNIKEAVSRVDFTDVQLSENFKSKYENFILDRKPNGYAKVDWARHSTKITTSTGKLIFITNFWFYIASELSNYLDSLSQQKEIFSSIFSGENLQEIANLLRQGEANEQREKIQKYFSLHNLSSEDLNNFLEFVSDYKSWGGGKTIDRNDYYVSPLLQAGNLLAETQSAVAEIAKQMSENEELKNSFKPIFQKEKILAKKIQDDAFSSRALLPKPFLLLAGISGTGKTRFVREQAKASGQFDETYCLTSVRPDWHEPSDLLGYISRLSNSGQAEYVTTDVLQFIAKAWRGIFNSGLTIDEQHIEDLGKRLVVSGDRAALDAVLPYWLCLDEMNLAPVEQYFADYLSVLETREWQWTGDDFTYGCDALLKPTTIKEVANTDSLRKKLGFEQPEYDELWQLICKHGLSIPFNLIVAGTVNMDETTHGFSRKVIDRALSFDFGNFFPNNYDEFFTSPNINKSLSYPIGSQATKDDLSNTVDSEGEKTVAFLTSVNAVLKNTPFELAYRALNELLLSVISCQPQDELTLQAVWDDFMMCKVLPRIEGDSDKLFVLGVNSAEDATLLQHLATVLQQELGLIWNEIEGSPNARPDLYRERKVAGAQIDKESEVDAVKIIRINCRTKDKLNWMTQRLEASTFTSFWP